MRIKIKHMEVEIRRRESAGAGSNTYNESETLAKYEVMDGAPVRGESVPVRYVVFLAFSNPSTHRGGPITLLPCLPVYVYETD